MVASVYNCVVLSVYKVKGFALPTYKKVPKMSFLKDLSDAQVFEKLTVDQLNRLGLGASHCTDKPTKDCPHPPDVLLEGGVSIDVKHDIMSAKTSNLCIEEATLVKGSADYLLYYADYDKGTLFLFDCKYLLKNLEALAEEGKVRVVGNAGDARKRKGGVHKVYLVPIKDIYKLRLLAKSPPFDERWFNDYRSLIYDLPF